MNSVSRQIVHCDMPGCPSFDSMEKKDGPALPPLLWSAEPPPPGQEGTLYYCLYCSGEEK